MTLARFWTAQQVLDHVATEVGLAAPGANVYSSTDGNVIKLRGALNAAGLDLTLAHRWPYPLTKEHTITIANPGDSGTYNLPDDWNGLVDDSEYERNTLGYRLIPVGPDEWQYLKTGAIVSTLRIHFRLDAETLRLYTLPANGTVVGMEYHSRWWAKTSGQALPDKDTCTASTDVVYFDSRLIAALTKLKYRTAQGEDTTAALVEFEGLYATVCGRSVAARPLRLGGGGGFHFLDETNLPDTGFGS